MKQKMLLLKSIKTRILKKKQRGAAQLIATMFAMLALIIVLFLTVYTVEDLDRIQVVDQIARGAVLKLETRGKLSTEEITAIKTDLQNRLGASFDGKSGDKPDGVYAQYKKDSGWVDIPAEGVPYGTEVGIYIQCEVKTTKLTNGMNMFNTAMTKEKTQIKRMKTSISKAPTKN